MALNAFTISSLIILYLKMDLENHTILNRCEWMKTIGLHQQNEQWSDSL